MKPKRFFSFYRCVCIIAVFCLFLLPLAGALRVRAFPGADCLLASLLVCAAVLLMLPVGEESARASFRHAVWVLPVCGGGVLAGWPARIWVLPALLLQAACMLGWCREQYAQIFGTNNK